MMQSIQPRALSQTLVGRKIGWPSLDPGLVMTSEGFVLQTVLINCLRTSPSSFGMGAYTLHDPCWGVNVVEPGLPRRDVGLLSRLKISNEVGGELDARAVAVVGGLRYPED